MAFITQKGESPLDGVDDGIYSATITAFERVENRFKGKLFNENAPEGKDNQRNTYEFQYEATLDVEVGGDTVEAKVWANPTTGEKSKLRKVAKAADAWTTNEAGDEGFDDEDMVGRSLRVLVQDGKIDNFLKAK